MIVHQSSDGAKSMYELCRMLARALYKSDEARFPKLVIKVLESQNDSLSSIDIALCTPSTIPSGQDLSTIAMVAVDGSELLTIESTD